MLFINTTSIIFDDHKLFAQSFAGFLERLGLFSQVLVVENEEEVIPTLLKSLGYRSIYFFLDHIIKDGNSIHLQNDTKRISKKLKTIIITSSTHGSVINNIIMHKPAGIISKTSGADVIMECLSSIEKGQLYICPEIKSLISNNDISTLTSNPFTDREVEILQYFAKGFSISETAEQVHLSRYTIINHRSNMMRKSGVKSIVSLLAYARKLQLI